MKFFLPLVLLASSLCGQRLAPYNVEFDPDVSVTVIDWGGQPALLAFWDPQQMNSLVYRRTPQVRIAYEHFVKFHDQPTNKLRLVVEGAAFIHPPTAVGRQVAIGNSIEYQQGIYTTGSRRTWNGQFPHFVVPWTSFPQSVPKLEYIPPTTLYGSPVPAISVWAVGYIDGAVCPCFPYAGTPSLVAMVFTIEQV